MQDILKMRKIASVRIPRGKWSSPYPNKVCLESSKSTEKVHLVDTLRLSEITSILDFGVFKMFPFYFFLRLIPVRRQHLHQTRRVQGLLQGRGNNPHLGYSPTPQGRRKGLRRFCVIFVCFYVRRTCLFKTCDFHCPS